MTETFMNHPSVGDSRDAQSEEKFGLLDVNAELDRYRKLVTDAGTIVDAKDAQIKTLIAERDAAASQKRMAEAQVKNLERSMATHKPAGRPRRTPSPSAKTDPAKGANSNV